MKLIAVIFLISLASCAATQPDHAEQAVLVCYIREANNKAVCKLRTLSGKEVTYYDGHRGMGKVEWQEGTRYTVHFKGNTIVKITKNQP